MRKCKSLKREIGYTCMIRLLKKGLSRKLTKRWRGPYIITERLSSVNYRIVQNGIQRDVHVDRLRLVESERDLLSTHEYDLTLAENEIEAIRDTQRALIARQDYLQDEKAKLEASKQVEQEISENNLNSMSVIQVFEDTSYIFGDCGLSIHLP